jgi:predicted O-methyltransferase YrrM
VQAIRGIPVFGLLSELFDIIAVAAKLRIAERKCHNLNDYFHLIQSMRGPLTIKDLAPIQKQTEIVSFLAKASELPIESALEIGTANGGTFYLLCKVAKRSATLITVDIKNDWRRAALLRSYLKVGQRIRVIRGDSREEKIFRKITHILGSRKLDLLFIDGDHSFIGVSTDFELYSRLVRPGGVVAMHDIIPDYETRYGIATPNYAGDVPRFWNTIRSKWKSEEFVESYEQDAYGVGVIRWDS